jgi:hypothetical protein
MHATFGLENLNGREQLEHLRKNEMMLKYILNRKRAVLIV